MSDLWKENGGGMGGDEVDLRWIKENCCLINSSKILCQFSIPFYHDSHVSNHQSLSHPPELQNSLFILRQFVHQTNEMSI